MFYGLATMKIRPRLVTIRHVLEDIESLNRKATESAYELTAISYHAYPYLADKYVLMASGSRGSATATGRFSSRPAHSPPKRSRASVSPCRACSPRSIWR
jgi:predicted solute-binding protein